MICVRTVSSVNNTVTNKGVRRGIDIDAVTIWRVESLVRWVPQPNAAISARRLFSSFLRRFVLSLSWQYHGFEFTVKGETTQCLCLRLHCAPAPGDLDLVGELKVQGPVARPSLRTNGVGIK